MHLCNAVKELRVLENIVINYPSWYLILCLLLGVVYALMMYFRDGRFEDKPGFFKWILGILRGAAVSILAFLLLTPLIKSVIENQKNPIIIVAEDASESIEQSMTADQLITYKQSIDDLTIGLSQKYEVKRLHYGDEVKTGKADSFAYKVTNLSNAIKYISDNYGDQNVGAVIMTGDGIFNEGSNPIYQNSDLVSPLYAVALGDTTQKKDLVLKDVFFNKIVYLGDQFNLQIDIAAQNCSNQQTSLQIFEVSENGQKKLKEEKINIKGSDFFTTRELTLDANKAGIRKFRVVTTGIKGEALSSNNSKDIYVEVLDARQKILLFADSPHPDIAALKSGILNNKNYTFEVKYAVRDNPVMTDYDLVIFHNLPSAETNLSTQLEILNRRKTPRLFIVGRQTHLPTFNKVQEIVTLGGNNTQTDEVQAIFKSGFSSFTIDEELKKNVSRFPPLIAPFGKYAAGPKANVLLYQRIGKVDTDYPLMSFGEEQRTKTAVITAEGLWKWKLFNYLEKQNHDDYNTLIGKIIQFTAVKDDKRKFRTDVGKNVYKENEAVRIEAQLFNDSYESINEPDVFISIYDANKKEYKYTFSKKDNYYLLEPGLFKEGRYSYQAKTTYNGKELTDKGNFSVKSIQLEQYDLTARHDVLVNLADKYGGKVFYPNQIDELSSAILSNEKIKPILYASNKTQSILNIRWILGALILLLILEWFLRRYHGSY